MLALERTLDITEIDRAEKYGNENPNHLLFLNLDRTDFEGRGEEFGVTICVEDEDGLVQEIFFPSYLYDNLRQAYDVLLALRTELWIRQTNLVDLICINDHVTNDGSTMGFGICGNCMSYEKVEEEMAKAIEHETKESKKPHLTVVH